MRCCPLWHVFPSCKSNRSSSHLKRSYSFFVHCGLSPGLLGTLRCCQTVSQYLFQASSSRSNQKKENRCYHVSSYYRRVVSVCVLLFGSNRSPQIIYFLPKYFCALANQFTHSLPRLVLSLRSSDERGNYLGLHSKPRAGLATRVRQGPWYVHDKPWRLSDGLPCRTSCRGAVRNCRRGPQRVLCHTPRRAENHEFQPKEMPRKMLNKLGRCPCLASGFAPSLRKECSSLII